MSKSFEIYRELISYALTFAEGAETFPSKEKIYRKALKKALITYTKQLWNKCSSRT